MWYSLSDYGEYFDVSSDSYYVVIFSKRTQCPKKMLVIFLINRILIYNWLFETTFSKAAATKLLG